jgi:hypothetical protein
MIKVAPTDCKHIFESEFLASTTQLRPRLPFGKTGWKRRFPFQPKRGANANLGTRNGDSHFCLRKWNLKYGNRDFFFLLSAFAHEKMSYRFLRVWNQRRVIFFLCPELFCLMNV